MPSGAQRLHVLLPSLLLLVACSRSAQTFATTTSGLNVPNNAKVVSFTDTASDVAGRDLGASAQFTLTPAELAPLIKQMELGEFVRITGDSVAQLAVAPGSAVGEWKEVQPWLPPGSVGYVRHQPKASSLYRLTVIDSTRGLLTVRVDLQAH